jgi:hypothetical protein
MSRIKGRFAWLESRRRVRSFVRGLVADGTVRVNGLTMAEDAGENSPAGMHTSCPNEAPPRTAEVVG